MADEQTTETPATPLTVDPKALADLVNSAVSSHLKRAEAKQTESFKSMLAEFAKTIQPPAPQTPTETDESPKKGKVSPELAAMQAKLDDMARVAKESQDKAAKAEAKQKQDRAQADLRNSLSGKVRPEVLDSLTRMLFADGKIELDENGTPFFKTRRAPLPGMPEEDQLLPLADGVEGYLKSNEAVGFLPAPGGGQSSPPRTASRFPNTPAPGPRKYDAPAKTDEEKVRRAYEQEIALKQRLGG